MAFGKRRFATFGQAADHRYRGRGEPQQVEMAASAYAITDQTGKPHFRIEMSEAVSDRCDRPRDPGSIDDQQHWGVEPLRNLGRGTLVGGRRRRIEEPHHPLDNREISVLRGTRKGFAHALAPHHPAVEIVRRSSGGAGVITRIEIIRTAFEWSDFETLCA